MYVTYVCILDFGVEEGFGGVECVVVVVVLAAGVACA